MRFTILGASGFIGTNLCNYCKSNSIDFFAPHRDYIFNGKDDLGHVIYAIGLTADFRKRPLQTVQAHVSKVLDFLQTSRFHSFLYLSSTRVYSGLTGQVDEATSLIVNPNKENDLYNISKLMGESLCLSVPNRNIKVARISNVVGNDFNSDNFIFSLLREIKTTNKIQLQSSLESSKDYISVNDVSKILFDISMVGKERLYNVATGFNITNKEIIDLIAQKRNFNVEVSACASKVIFPEIDITKIATEFSYTPGGIQASLNNIIEHFFNH